MTKKVMISLYGDEIAPRFDLATEVVIATFGQDGQLVEERTMVLPQASAEQLCHMVLTEDIHVVVCGGIEEEYYQYLTWKRIKVYHSVMGAYDKVLERLVRGELQSGDMLFEREGKCP